MPTFGYSTFVAYSKKLQSTDAYQYIESKKDSCKADSFGAIADQCVAPVIKNASSTISGGFMSQIEGMAKRIVEGLMSAIKSFFAH